MYKEMRGEKEMVAWKKLMYKNQAQSKLSFILWMTLLERIPTKDRLMRFRFISDATCCLCNHLETIEHLFFDRNTTKNIWKDILDWLGYDSQPNGWTNKKKLIIQETKKKGWKWKMLKISMAKTLYSIRKSINELIFSPKKVLILG